MRRAQVSVHVEHYGAGKSSADFFVQGRDARKPSAQREAPSRAVA